MKTVKILAALLAGLAAGAAAVYFLTPLIGARPLPPEADYGDAPDGLPAGYAPPFQDVVGRFPTRYDTENSRVGGPGAPVLDASLATLGEGASLERGPLDPSDPDLIQNMVGDDGWDDGLSISEFPPLRLNATLSEGARAGTWYLNVLVDLDHDGAWRGEWVVRNEEVSLTPGETRQVALPIPTPYPPAWMRVALTDSPIDPSAYGEDGWDGSGEFAAGEVEDYLYGFFYRAAESFNLSVAWAATPDVAASAAVEAAASAEAYASSTVSRISSAYSTAQSLASQVAETYAEARSTAESVSAMYASAQTAAEAVSSAAVRVPCGQIAGEARGRAEAALEVASRAEAMAEAAAEALASASAQAEAAAEAIGEALAEAEAEADAAAEARSWAEANASAAADAWAAALAQAAAYQATAGGHFFSVPMVQAAAFTASLASAWARAYAAAAAAADALSAAMAAADALSEAQSAAETLTAAYAQAQAYSQVASHASAMAEAALRSASEAQAFISAVASQGCCCAATSYGGLFTILVVGEGRGRSFLFTSEGVSVGETGRGLTVVYEEGWAVLSSEKYLLKRVYVPFDQLSEAPVPGEGQTHEDLGYSHELPADVGGVYVLYNPEEGFYAKLKITSVDEVRCQCEYPPEEYTQAVAFNVVYAYCPKRSPSFEP